MSPGQHQQKLRDELRERFIKGPAPTQLRAILSATERARDEASGELILARHEIERLGRALDDARKRLARAREVLAELDPGRYWQECRAL
jgi:hypothetical protein